MASVHFGYKYIKPFYKNQPVISLNANPITSKIGGPCTKPSILKKSKNDADIEKLLKIISNIMQN